MTSKEVKMENKTNWWMVVAILAIVLLLFSGSGMMGFGRGGFGCFGSSGYNYSNGMMSWMFGNPFGWILGLAMMIILGALAIFILIYFIKMISESLNHQESLYGVKNGKRKNH